MFLGRHHELRGAWSRYVVCNRHDASRYPGRVLSGYAAERVISELLADRTDQQVRRLYAELSASFDLRRVSDDEVQRWFSCELGGSVRGAGSARIVLIEVPMFGRLGRSSEDASAGAGASSEAEQLIVAMESARGKSDLVHAGSNFQLVVVARAGQLAGRDHYEALAAPEAQRVLQAMAADSRFSDSLRELLKKAVALVTAGQNGRREEQLLLLRRFRSPAPAAKPAEPPVVPSQPARARVSKPRSYIAVEVYSQDGAAMPGISLELTAPDGTLSRLTTDDTGEAALHDLEPGSFRIAVLSHDLTVWKAGGASGQLLRKQPGRAHLVKQGECLSQLAHAAGIADWRKLWDHPDNASLKAKRKSPNVLLPGDSVFLPGIDVGQIERPTGATHRITVSAEAGEVEVLLAFADHLGEALANQPYELTFRHDGQDIKRTGQLSGAGQLTESVPAGLMTAALLLTQREETYCLALGHLDPAQENGEAIENGAAARLGALGYLTPHTRDHSADELRAAVGQFQQSVMERSDPKGDLDHETLTKLEETHGA